MIDLIFYGMCGCAAHPIEEDVGIFCGASHRKKFQLRVEFPSPLGEGPGVG